MKRIITAVLALLMATGCNAQNKQEVKSSNKNNMNKSIVIFFSHAGDNYSVGNIEVGNTKIVADYITDCRLTKAPLPTSANMTLSSSAVLCGGAPTLR